MLFSLTVFRCVREYMCTYINNIRCKSLVLHKYIQNTFYILRRFHTISIAMHMCTNIYIVCTYICMYRVWTYSSITVTCSVTLTRSYASISTIFSLIHFQPSQHLPSPQLSALSVRTPTTSLHLLVHSPIHIARVACHPILAFERMQIEMQIS